MSSETGRAPVFDSDDLDLTGFKPKPVQPGANREQVRAVSEPAAFTSREAKASPVRRERRQHRTGRNVQLNLKVRQEDADAFYDLADQNGWVLGEAFEMAIEALRKDLGV